MDIFLKILPYAVNLLSGILLACATYTINKARKNHEEDRRKEQEQEKAINDGVQALLRESIVNNYNKYNSKGYCPIYAKEAVRRSFDAYTKLGGNDVAHGLYDKIIKMPEEPEKKEDDKHE